MQKALGAMVAAVLFASQAGAATVTGPTTVTAGQTYTYIYDPGPVDLIEGYQFYVLRVRVNDDGYFERAGTTYPEDSKFMFNWVFDTTGPAFLNVSSYLESYVGAVLTGTFDRPIVFKPVGWMADVAESQADKLQISVVPIGGTLPLMLSALGLMGWAARRRSKQNALPA